MKLHIDIMGKGPSLLMLHGWGGNGGVWSTVRDELAGHFQLILLDLPGHGASQFDAKAMQDMAALADCIAEQIEQPVFCLGWSLGGMAALALAQRHPQKVKALITVASAPRFLCAGDWPDAVDGDVLAVFSRDVQDDPRAMLSRFIALQTRGSATQRDDARVLRQAMLENTMANPAALQAGLALLEKTDLRAGVPALKCPLLIMAGERDGLHPLAGMQAYAALSPSSRLQVINKAGHAPFISHKREFVDSVLAFLHANADGMSRRA